MRAPSKAETVTKVTVIIKETIRNLIKSRRYIFQKLIASSLPLTKKLDSRKTILAKRKTGETIRIALRNSKKKASILAR
jgi:hypothetical protein